MKTSTIILSKIIDGQIDTRQNSKNHHFFKIIKNIIKKYSFGQIKKYSILEQRTFNVILIFHENLNLSKFFAITVNSRYKTMALYDHSRYKTTFCGVRWGGLIAGVDCTCFLKNLNSIKTKEENRLFQIGFQNVLELNSFKVERSSKLYSARGSVISLNTSGATKWDLDKYYWNF